MPRRLAPGMREAGSGPMSDKDLEVFKSAVLSLNNTPYANYISLYTFKRAKENMIKENISITVLIHCVIL